MSQAFGSTSSGDAGPGLGTTPSSPVNARSAAGGALGKSTGHVGTRSIGEVLALLKTEFDDISISKIRFLESEGLVTPQRTPSGYRKFSNSDIERLRYILRQQKENFLPLKVIRERLEAGERSAESAPVEESTQESTAPSKPETTLPAGPMSRRELIQASGLTESTMRELEKFNLVRAERTATGLVYDSQSLAIARLAGRFLNFGVEPRHLRIFRTSADREADLYQQLVMPHRAARTVEAQTEARARVEELMTLGAALHDELLRQALDNL